MVKLDQSLVKYKYKYVAKTKFLGKVPRLGWLFIADYIAVRQLAATRRIDSWSQLRVYLCVYTVWLKVQTMQDGAAAFKRRYKTLSRCIAVLSSITI